MTDITLKTAFKKQTEGKIIPKGTTGTLIDIIIEEGRVMFLLEFDDLDIYEWYEVDEVEEKF